MYVFSGSQRFQISLLHCVLSFYKPSSIPFSFISIYIPPIHNLLGLPHFTSILCTCPNSDKMIYNFVISDCLFVFHYFSNSLICCFFDLRSSCSSPPKVRTFRTFSLSQAKRRNHIAVFPICPFL